MLGGVSMFEQLLGRFPPLFVIFCAFLSGFVPLLVYKLNKKIHELGDPPWKNEKK